MSDKCFLCSKKLCLTDIKCRCGNKFCSKHRYSDIHNCPFDYKAQTREKIKKENPIIVANKIDTF